MQEPEDCRTRLCACVTCSRKDSQYTARCNCRNCVGIEFYVKYDCLTKRREHTETREIH